MPNITFKKVLASDGKYYDVNFTQVAGPVIVPPPSDPAPTPEPVPSDTGTFPNATNTGVPSGVTLRNSGSITISQSGAVVEGLNISGSVNITASGVTLKNCKITSSSNQGVVNIKSGIFATVQDCEINGVGTGNDGSHGIYGQGTFKRNNIYNVENGITLNNGDSLIQGNYIHDLLASGAPHYDGIQMDGGQKNVTIEGNTIINQYNQTAAIMIDNYFGPISNVKVYGNYLKGGGYTVYSDGQFKGGTIQGVSFVNNKMGKGSWGYASIVNNAITQSGNTDLNGAAIKL